MLIWCNVLLFIILVVVCTVRRCIAPLDFVCEAELKAFCVHLGSCLAVSAMSSSEPSSSSCSSSEYDAEEAERDSKVAQRKQAFAQKRRERARIAKNLAKVIKDKCKDSVRNLRKKSPGELAELTPDDLPAACLVHLMQDCRKRHAAQEYWDAKKRTSD